MPSQPIDLAPAMLDDLASARRGWVWIPDGRPDRNTFVHFRRCFNVNPAAAPHVLLVSADFRYRLWVNGRWIADGPPPSTPRLAYVDVHDLTAHLVPGDNVITMLVRQHKGKFLDARQGGLIAGLYDQQASRLFITDTQWKCRRANAWAEDTYAFDWQALDPFQEHFDAARLPAGWREQQFNDEAWASAKPVRRPPWRDLALRDIPAMQMKPLTPRRIVTIEECLWLESRPHRHDASIELSQVGEPIRRAAAENVHLLLHPQPAHNDEATPEDASTVESQPVIFQSHTPADGDWGFDGVYDPCMTIDMGRLVTAHVEIDVEAEAGEQIDIGLAERLVQGRFNNAIEGQFAYRIRTAHGRTRWRSFLWRSFRYIRLRVRTQRAPLRLHSLRVIESRYPFEHGGGFEAGDARMNRLFDIGRQTLQLVCNESICDTPWREQGQYLGDASAVTLGGMLACFGPTSLASKFHRQAAVNMRRDRFIQTLSNADRPDDSRGLIPDFSLWWVMAVWKHYLHTGDRELLEHLYPAVDRVMARFMDFQSRSHLIADLPGWVYVDWAPIQKHGAVAAVNAMFIGAADALVNMHAAMGKQAPARRWRKIRQTTREAFVEQFLDPKREVFVDCVHEGRRSDAVSEHANAAAIVWRICDARMAQRLVDRIWVNRLDGLVEAQPLFTGIVLQALDRAGRFDLALRMLEMRYGKRMLDRDATSGFEEWSINGSWRQGRFAGFMRSAGHAFGAYPAEFCIRLLGGVEILEPGCRRVRVDPRPAPFEYRIAFPTPHGPIHIERKGEHVRVDPPAGVSLAGPASPESNSP